MKTTITNRSRNAIFFKSYRVHYHSTSVISIATTTTTTNNNTINDNNNNDNNRNHSSKTNNNHIAVNEGSAIIA